MAAPRRQCRSACDVANAMIECPLRPDVATAMTHMRQSASRPLRRARPERRARPKADSHLAKCCGDPGREKDAVDPGSLPGQIVERHPRHCCS